MYFLLVLYCHCYFPASHPPPLRDNPRGYPRRHAEPLSMPPWVSLSSVDVFRSDSGSSWCQAGCGCPLVPSPSNLETRGWPQSGLLPSVLPRSGVETDSSAPFYGSLAELYQEKTELCVCTFEGRDVFCLPNPIHSCRIPPPILRKHSLKLEEAFVWKVMKFCSNRGRK